MNHGQIPSMSDIRHHVWHRSCSGPLRLATPTPTAVPLSLDLVDLDRFVSEHRLALIEMWAEWSGSAFLVGAVLDRILSQAPHEVVARGRIDVGTHPDAPALFGLEGPPAVLLYRDGHLVDRLPGLLSPERLGARLLELETLIASEDSR